jgi:eukaryotic translation initiation factor 2C
VPPSPASPDLKLSELSLEDRLPRRPAFGSEGRQVVLWANYFELNTKLDTILHRYSIAVRPDANGKKLEQIVRLLLEEEDAFVARKKDIASDFRSTIITRSPLDEDCLGEFQVAYRSEFEDEPKASATTYAVRVQDSRMTHSMRRLVEYMTSTTLNAAYEDRLPTIQALNIVMGDYTKRKKDIVMVGPSKSYSTAPDNQPFNLSDTLKALRGFFSSVRLASSRMLVNVNVSHSAFYPAIKLVDLMRARGRNPHQILPFIKGLKVQTTHLRAKVKHGVEIPRVKTISSFARPGDGQTSPHPPIIPAYGAGADAVQFWLEEGGPQTSSQPAPTSTPKGGRKKGKGKEGHDPKPSPSGPSTGRYITVEAFFKQG